MDSGIPLEGGNSTPVHRVGSTVRRATGAHSAAVHTLLTHLEECGVEGVPRFLGIDDEGREVLSHSDGGWDDSTDLLARFTRIFELYPDPCATAITARAEAGDLGVATQIREDHIGIYRRDQEFISDHRQQISDAAAAGLHAD